MKQDKQFYITTPIYYVNGVPHIGHFYSSVLADTIARFNRISWKETRYTTWVDENSQKAIAVADERSMKIMDYLDEMAGKHKNVWDSLNIEYTDFIRTTEERHHKVVREVLQKSFNNKDVYSNRDIYEGEYEWMYCIWCEAFKKDDELIEYDGDQVCPDHLTKPDKIKEKNYFFRLSRYQTWMEEFYEANQDFVIPSDRFNEVIAFTKRWLEDFSISRETNTFWIKLPFDETQVTYVWFDALYNYYTSVYNEKEFFPANVHVVGKDIIRFHAIFWPAMLASNFGLWEEIDGILHYKKSDRSFLPKTILTTGHFTVDWVKMSKSLWNVIDPLEYSKELSKDVLTLYLLWNSNIWYDWDFDNKQAILTYNAKLANNFGNLLNRVVILGEKLKNCIIKSPQSVSPKGIELEQYNENFSNFLLEYNLKSALDQSFSYLDDLNKFVDVEKPWELLKSNPKKAEEILYILAEWVRQVWLNLYNFFPEKMLELFERLWLEGYKEILESWKLKELRNKTEIFKIKKIDWVLFERFELPEEKEEEIKDKKINFTIQKEVSELGLHAVYAFVEVPKIITRRNWSLKSYIKEELENINFNDIKRLSILQEAESFYKKNKVESAIHPSVHLQKLVENTWKLPNINNVVDSYNIESLKSGLSIWVHDISKIKGEEVIIKLSSWKENFIPLWWKEIINIGAGEFACTDNNWNRIICRMDCKQGFTTIVDKDTKNIFIYIQWNSACNKEYLEETLNKVVNNLVEFCGGKLIK
jgi:methionyl-tRNA synthetase